MERKQQAVVHLSRIARVLHTNKVQIREKNFEQCSLDKNNEGPMQKLRTFGGKK